MEAAASPGVFSNYKTRIRAILLSKKDAAPTDRRPIADKFRWEPTNLACKAEFALRSSETSLQGVEVAFCLLNFFAIQSSPPTWSQRPS